MLGEISAGTFPHLYFPASDTWYMVGVSKRQVNDNTDLSTFSD